MEGHLHMHERMDRGTRSGHFIQRFRLGRGKRPSAGEVNQENIVLPQVMQIAGLWQTAVAQLFDKVMAGIGPPSLSGATAPCCEGLAVIGRRHGFACAVTSTTRSAAGITVSTTPLSCMKVSNRS